MKTNNLICYLETIRRFLLETFQRCLTIEHNNKKQANKTNQQNIDRIKAGLPVLGSFADVAYQWLKSLEHLTKPQTHTKKTSRIERLAFPLLGDKPIQVIKAADVLAV